MKKYRRFIPLVIPLIVWFLSQAFLIEPPFFYSALALGVLLITLSVRSIVRQNAAGDWPPFIISPVLFFLSFSTYATMIVGRFWIQLIFLLVAWFLFSYFKNLYYYSTYSVPERADKLDSLLSGGGFLTIFAAAGVLFGLPTFLNWPLIATLLIFVPIVWLLLIQFFPLKVGWHPSGSLLFIMVMILTELAWVFSLLPLSFNLLAFFLAIAYYLSILIVRLDSRGGLVFSALKLPLILSAIAVLVLLLTARWL